VFCIAFIATCAGFIVLFCRPSTVGWRLVYYYLQLNYEITYLHCENCCKIRNNNNNNNNNNMLLSQTELIFCASFAVIFNFATFGVVLNA
jgi:hypothetical protein